MFAFYVVDLVFQYSAETLAWKKGQKIVEDFLFKRLWENVAAVL